MGAPETPVILESASLRAAIAPGIGAGLLDLSLRGPGGLWFPLLRRTPPGAPHFNDLSMYLLAPWTNRIKRARFRFDGREIGLNADWPDGTAIHGAVKDKPFRLLDRSPISARFEFVSRGHANANWPWAFACLARYEVESDRVHCEVSVRNDDQSPMPAGVGFHPFLMRQLWDTQDKLRVCADVRARYPLRAVMPTGRARPDALCARLRKGTALDRDDLDDVFVRGDPRPIPAKSPDGKPEAWAAATYTASRVRVLLDASTNLGHTVIYNPLHRPKPLRGKRAPVGGPLPWLCVEPCSMVNDAFNLASRGEPGTGMVMLRPGERLAARFSIIATPIPAPARARTPRKR